MLMPEKRPSADERRLLSAFRALSDEQRETLLAFAEFLGGRGKKGSSAQPPAEPQLIAGPEGESVVAAIKRLSGAYPMLDRAVLLNEASALMSAHVMQGRPASEVIAELEALFASHYTQYKAALPAGD